MTEGLKQKAEAEADKVIIGSGMDRASVIHLKHLLVTMYIQGATEATQELEKENAELKSIADFQTSSNMDRYFQLKRSKDQLTKAKEHIENLLYYVKQCTCERSNYEEIEKDIKEAEQFLKNDSCPDCFCEDCTKDCRTRQLGLVEVEK